MKAKLISNCAEEVMGEKPKTRAAVIHESLGQRRRLCVLRSTIRNFLENIFRIARGRSIERLVVQNGVARDAHSG
jgi:hypothetical protein